MKRDDLAELVRGTLESHQLELDDLTVQRAGKRRMVRIVVDGDGPNGTGPDLDQMAEASRDISEQLDATNAMGENPYTLEVTSRGVSAPLTTSAHYRRNTGRLVTIERDGHDDVTGRIVAVHDDTVTLDVNGENHDFLLSDIDKAVVQIEMNRPAAKEN